MALEKEIKKIFQNLALSIIAFAAFAANSADFSGSATVPGGAKISFTNVAATNWVNGELVLKFTTTTGSHGFSLPGPAIADALVVAGGGAGGSMEASHTSGPGAGGGGGGFVESNDVVFVAGQYSVTVGNGGAKLTEQVSQKGNKGGKSLISGSGGELAQAEGGGGGAVAVSGQDTDLNGGCGGGGSYGGGSNAGGIGSQGGNGGSGKTYTTVSAGGGGAGKNGGDPTSNTVAGNGGNGKVSKIWDDTDITYAGGGGGSRRTVATTGNGAGGVGGGGAGGRRGLAAEDGTNGLGGGGGGGSPTGVGGAGGSGVVIVRISMALASDPVKPVSTTNVYDGVAHPVIAPSAAYEITGAAEGTDAGTYEATATLKPGFTWAGGGNEPVTVTLTIEKTPAEITGLHLDSWMVGTPEEKTPNPTCTVKPDCIAAQVEVVYQWKGVDEGAEWKDWLSSKPTEIGQYWVKAEIAEGANNLATNAVAPFAIVDDPANVFHDYVEITIDAYDATKVLTNFPYRVELKENNPEGFHYYNSDGTPRAGTTGENLSFTTPEGVPLPYCVGSDGWDAKGTSVLYVQIPLIGKDPQTIRLSWAPREGATVPPYTPDAVWTDLWPDEESTGKVSQPKSDFGVVDVDGTKFDRWIVKPMMDKPFWTQTESPGTVTNKGALKSDRDIEYTICNESLVPLDPQEMPTNAGVYKIVFKPTDETGYYPINEVLTVRVIALQPYGDLHDGAPTLTLGGRVMLANGDAADGTDEHKVNPEEGQGYWQVRSIKSGFFTYTFNPYWTHEGTHDVSGFPNLREGATHRLWHISDDQTKTNVIWRFNDVALGNTFASNGSLDSGLCYLPYSSTGYGTSMYSQRTSQGVQSEVGQMLLLNRTDAVIYSPCYTNGIGTLYFDTVNGWTREAGNDVYRFVVEIATLTRDGLPATDENAGEDLENIGRPGTAGIPADRCWRPVEMVPLRHRASGFTQEATTKELTLKVTEGGTMDNYYRICVPVDVDGVVRFRIRRTAVNGVRTDSAILIDNILVAFPKNDASVSTYGRYDGAVKPSEKDRTELGWKASTSVPFPSYQGAEADGIFARAKPWYRANAGSENLKTNFIEVVRLWYRWRYLDQITNDWQHVDLSKRDLGDGTVDFVATEPLALPQREGDVEYWYENYLSLPYYDYYDYSGATGDRPLGDYTEVRALGTNTLAMVDREPHLSSMGRDWFFRLRCGASPYETLLAIVRTADGVVHTNAMSLTADHRWRGTFKMPKEDRAGIDVRFAFVNRQTPGATEYEVNSADYYFTGETRTLPAVGALDPAGPGDWTHIPWDGLTGYILFQVEDESLGVSIVHADRQGFDGWTDALRPQDHRFVGNSTETSGVSSVKREFSGEIANWRESVGTNKLWKESFVVSSADMAPGKPWEVNKPFNSARTPNGLSAGVGQWVAGLYHDTTTLMALQMDGTSGYLQFIDSGATPRGIESITFKARLAQAIDPGLFSYYAGGALTALTNYTFTVRGAYDLAKRTTFSGNASLSLIAGYRPNDGFYELRVEQQNADTKGTGPGNIHLVTLYRWRYDETQDALVPTLLKQTTANNANYLNTNGEYGEYSALFISYNVLKNKTVVKGGLTQVAPVSGVVKDKTTAWVTMEDTSTARLKGGTYGLLTANSDGRFVKPEIAYNAALSATSGNYSQPSSTSCKDDLDPNVNDAWVVNSRRLEYYPGAGDFWGLKAVAPETQKVTVYTAPAGTENWSPFLTTNVTSYLMEDYVFNLWSTTDGGGVRIAPSANGTSKKRTDVVIDDFELKQWRGESWNDESQASQWTDYDLTWGAPTNFVFTQGWIESDGAEQHCQLNAKRALPGKSLSIRSPLFDGGEGRGLGLGMISFSYRNAQSNANVVVQIATNDVTLSGLKSLTDAPTAGWTTVTNFSFAGLSDAERAKGTCAYYLGLHAQKGVMRLVVTNVSAVASSRDPNLFGSIDITGVACSDEPDLDLFSWWGWNLRTTDEAAMRDLGDYYADTSVAGLAGALNNSIRADIVDSSDLYKKHLPFIQTPQFAADVVGEVSFKARKYRIGDADTQVVLFGAHRGAATDDQWEKIRTFKVETDTYATFTHKLLSGETFSAFRFVVTGVDDVDTPKMKDDEAPVNPLRVLIDDVVVMEAITAKVAFRNVAAFRGYLDSNAVVPDIMDKSHQPLCKEAFSVQCEVYAAQLASEVDLSKAKVTLWWYVGEKPWGFSSWRDDPKAHHAVLAECEGTNLIFRGSYPAAPEAVIGEEQKPTPVQYMLTVEFRNSDGSKGTSTLKEADWQNPPWYAPVDYNRTHDGFSAYTLLDSVPSGWAWINEVNIYGTEDRWGLNTDEQLQFVEIAAPVDADLTGWTVRFLDGQNANNRVVTNTVAKFGVQLPATKENPLSVASNCTFHVIASPESKGSFSASDGRIDGVWMVENDNNAVSVTRNNRGGVIQKSYPIGIQLVRPSGIVEHELVAVGTNRYEATHEVKNDPNAKVDLLNELCGTKAFFYAGQDSGGVPVPGGWSTSVGAMGNNGSPSSVFETNWSSEKLMTPGRINEGEEIAGLPPSPFGSSIRITSIVQSGHLLHTFGEMTEPTNAVSWIIYPKGSETGTNITYYADRWYVPATSVGTPVPTGAPGVWTLEVGKAISNDVTVTANAAPDPELVEKYGLGPDNRYAEAVVAWLSGGRTLGGEFANPDYTEPGLGDFYDLGGHVVTNLSLTAMYWLDMDPSYPAGVMSLRGGMHAYSPADPACNKHVEYPDGSIWSNRLLTVELYMTNTVSGETWAPYVLRGEEPGVTSWDYAEPTSTWSWTSANFKVTGILVNDLAGSGLGDRSSWKPLRWFVFDGALSPDGKPYTKSFDADYRSVIEISDPYRSVSAWKKWCEEHPGQEWPVWHSWDIDDRIMPVRVEPMRPVNEL